MDPNQNNNQLPNQQPQPVMQNPAPVIPPTTPEMPPTNNMPPIQPMPQQAPQATPQMQQPATNNLVQVNINTSQANVGQNKIYGILSIIFPIIGLAPVGLVLGIIGLRKAKKMGQKDILSRIGVILSAIVTIIIIISITSIIITASTTLKKCNELGPGTHQLSATSTITCGDTSIPEKTY